MNRHIGRFKEKFLFFMIFFVVLIFVVFKSFFRQLRRIYPLGREVEIERCSQYLRAVIWEID
jgi:hypothetical protein